MLRFGITIASDNEYGNSYYSEITAIEGLKSYKGTLKGAFSKDEIQSSK